MKTLRKMLCLFLTAYSIEQQEERVVQYPAAGTQTAHIVVMLMHRLANTLQNIYIMGCVKKMYIG